MEKKVLGGKQLLAKDDVMNLGGRLYPVTTILLTKWVCILQNHALGIKPATVGRWESATRKGKIKGAVT